ncbi:two-component system sensor histidine kinase DesK [Nonomuraea polychroma]|uniref:Two-component system sensor histidine kinase DesK n=1 Tax=Nonomuraea polychroma TaxID=46176 RepID=A0A438MC47_9ACTN|nr:histidine kinase [Nonomuraea polychroma]RVX43171.1 two-component system sensor histidine kinase DesK [Nonomuraea polychroma]
MRELLGRVRRASKLDKVRWLILGSTNIILLLPFFGFVELFIGWQGGRLPWPLGVGAAVLLLVFIVLSTRPIAIAVRGGKRPTAILTVTGVIVALLSVFPLIWIIPIWLALLAAFARKRTVIALSVASIVVVHVYVTLVEGFIVPLLLMQTLFTVISVGAVWANLRLWQLAKEAHEGQEALSRLAVSEERLRFARDLNDLLGQSLTDVASRAAHAEQALRADPAAAAAEMFEVRDLSRQSLREVRTAVQNYRALDLDEVLASVRAVLEAADVRCTVRADTAALTPESRTLLATVVREGATNVLKHSRAERCTITIEDGVLEMSNDGVSGPVGEHAPNGLGGLAERVRAAGGTLRAEPTREGRYLLRAAVPA